jgi:hypothetical protein
LGHFFGYFLFGLEKKVPRRPDGTGEVEVIRFRTQHFKFNTGGSRPARRLTLFACPNRVSRKKAPRSWPACGGFPPLRNRRAGGKDSLRSVLRLFRPPAAPFRRRHKGNNGNTVKRRCSSAGVKQSSSTGVCNSLPPTLANRLRCAKALRSGNDFDCVEEYDSGCRLRRQS